MRSIFPGHYRPTADESAEVWKSAVIVLDTNVLLNLYRFNAEDRTTLLTILERAKNRLWIPHYVALEYQHGRIAVVEGRLSSYKNFTNAANDAVESLKKSHSEKRIKDVDIEEFIKAIEESQVELEKKLAATSVIEAEELRSEALRQRIDDVFEGRIGQPPESQKWLDEIYRDGELRYENKVPPGFEDKKKKEIRTWAGLRFDLCYGDFLVWEQIQQQAVKEGWEYVLFITDDAKEDWWWTSNGQKLGPRPELVTEIRTRSKVKVFAMQTTVQFLQHAKDQFNVEVDSEMIENVKEVLGPRTSASIETISTGWQRQDFSVDESVDASTEFYFHAHTAHRDQIFVVYYQIASSQGSFWIGFTNREDGYYRIGREHTVHFGQSGRTSYEFVDSVASTIVERFPELKKEEVRIVRVRCRADAADRDTARFFIGVRKV